VEGDQPEESEEGAEEGDEVEEEEEDWGEEGFPLRTAKEGLAAIYLSTRLI